MIVHVGGAPVTLLRPPPLIVLGAAGPAQTQQILASIRVPAPDRAAAVVVEPVGTGMLP